MNRVKFVKKKKRAQISGYYVEKLDYVCGNFVRPLLSDDCVYYFDLITTLWCYFHLVILQD